MATLYVVSGGTGYSLSSGGTGDQTLNPTDYVIADGSSPNWTLTGALTCQKITFAAYTGTFDSGGFAIDVEEGIDGSTSGGMTIVGAGTTVTSRGDVRLHATATKTSAFTLLIVDGDVYLAIRTDPGSGTWFTTVRVLTGRNVSMLGNVNLILQAYGHVTADASIAVSSLLVSGGSVTVNSPYTLTIVSTASIDDTTQLSATSIRHYAYTFNPFTQGTYTSPVWVYAVENNTIDIRNSTFAAGLQFHDLSAVTLNITCDATTEVQGDIAATIDSGATVNLNGTMSLTGTADQSVNFTGVSTASFGLIGNKSAGIVTVTGSADIAAGGDWGTIVANGSADYTITPGVDGLNFSSYTGSFDAAGYDIALGTDGLTSSGGTGTILMGEGVWGTTGDFIANGLGAVTKETSTLVMKGGTSGDRAVLNTEYIVGRDLYNLVFNTGSYINLPTSTVIYGSLVCDADVTIDTNYILQDFQTSTFLANAVMSGSGRFALGSGTCTIADGSTFSMQLTIYAAASLSVTGRLAGLLDVRNYGTATLALSNLSLTDVRLYQVAAFTMTVSFSNVDVVGDISSLGSTGSIVTTGVVTLTGTDNQSIDLSGVDTSGLSFTATKSAGDIAIAGSGDVTMGGDWSVYSVSFDAGYTGTFDSGGYNIDVEAGIDASAASGMTIVGAGTTITSRGDVKTHPSLTVTSEFAVVQFQGGTVGSPLVSSLTRSTTDSSTTKIIVDAGSYVSVVRAAGASLYARAIWDIQGNVTSTTSAIAADGLTLGASGSINIAASLLLINGTQTIVDASNITALVVQYYTSLTNFVQGNYISKVEMYAYSTPKTYDVRNTVFGGGLSFTDAVLHSGNTFTMTCDATTEVQGNISATIDEGAIIDINGVMTLSGTADQSIDFTGVDTSGLGLIGNKSAGIVTVTGSADFAVGGDWGSVVDNGSGDYTVTPGADGLVLGAALTGEFDAAGYDLALGVDGFDASAASGATVRMGEGTWASQGQFTAHATTTWYEETSACVLDGGAIGSEAVLSMPYVGGGPGGGDTQFYKLAINTGAAYSTANPTTVVRNLFTSRGRLSFGSSTNLNCMAVQSILYDGASMRGGTAAAYNLGGSGAHVEDPAECQVGILIYAGTLTSGTGTFPTRITVANYVSSTANLSGLNITDLVLSKLGAFANTTNLNGTTIAGNVSTSGSTGTIAVTGTATLTGTSNQAVNLSGTDVSALSWVGNKTSGTVTFSGSANVTAGGDWGSITDNGLGNYALTTGADGITLGATFSGIFDANDNDIVIGDFDASAASGATINMGSGTWAIS